MKNYREDFIAITNLIDNLIEDDSNKQIDTFTEANNLHVIMKMKYEDILIEVRDERGEGFKFENTTLTTVTSMYDQWMEWFETVFNEYIK